MKKIIKAVALIVAAVLTLSCFVSCNADATPSELILGVGNSAKLKPSKLFLAIGEDATVTWYSENEEIVTVDESGVVSYVSAGVASVIAEGTSADGKKSAEEEFIITCEVDVTKQGMVLSTPYVNLKKSGETYQLQANLLHEGDSIVSWESSDDTIASVEGGKITYMSPGRAVVTAKTKLGFTESCNVMCDSIVMTVGDIEITDSMYGYWFSSYKTQVVQYNIGSDYPEVWATELKDGGTFGELFCDNVYSSVLQMLAANLAYVTEFGGRPDDIEAMAKSQVELAQNENGGAEILDAVLANFYVDSDILCDIFEIEEITNRYYASMFEEGSPDFITEENIMTKFLSEYVQVEHILIDIYYYYDEEYDDYLYNDEEAQEEKREFAKELFEKIENGETDFDTAREEHSDDLAENENGYIFTRDGSFDDVFTDNAFEMGVGEYRMFESEYGVHIMTKYELTEEDLTEELATEISSAISTERFSSKLSKYEEGANADREKLTTSYDVTTAPLFTDYT